MIVSFVCGYPSFIALKLYTPGVRLWNVTRPVEFVKSISVLTPVGWLVEETSALFNGVP